MFNHALAAVPNLIPAIESAIILPGFTVGKIFVWSLGAGSLLALAVIIYGGTKYIVSAGNDSKQGNAKEWIWAAISGLILLAVSYLILNYINPAILL